MCPQATGRSARAWMSRTLKLTAAAVAPIVLSLEFVMALQSTRLLIVLLPRLRIKTAISYVHYCTLQIESIVIVASANRPKNLRDQLFLPRQAWDKLDGKARPDNCNVRTPLLRWRAHISPAQSTLVMRKEGSVHGSWY